MCLFYPAFWTGRAGVALLLLRLVMGAAFVLHGWGKIQHAFDWMGPGMPGILQALAAFAEFGGGIAMIVGLLTPFAALGLIFTMLGAIFIAHVPAGDPFVATGPGQGSYELAAVYLIISVAVLLLGPGGYSLDALLMNRNKKSAEPS